MSFVRTGALRGPSQEEMLIEVSWLGAGFKDKMTQLLLARGSRRLQVKEATHRRPDAFMYSAVSGERRKKFVFGHAVRVLGENGGTAALTLNFCWTEVSEQLLGAFTKFAKNDY